MVISISVQNYHNPFSDFHVFYFSKKIGKKMIVETKKSFATLPVSLKIWEISKKL